MRKDYSRKQKSRWTKIGAAAIAALHLFSSGSMALSAEVLCVDGHDVRIHTDVTCCADPHECAPQPSETGDTRTSGCSQPHDHDECHCEHLPFPADGARSEALARMENPSTLVTVPLPCPSQHEIPVHLPRMRSISRDPAIGLWLTSLVVRRL